MFSKLVSITSLFLALNLMVTGCVPRYEDKDANKNKIDADAIFKDQKLAPSEKAEHLAKAAEQLLTVQGFAYASDMANLALQIDSNNLRAQFVKAILAPIMVQKGIISRIAPLADKDANFKNEYNKMMLDINTKYPNSTLKSFLLDGPADIHSETDIQAYTDSLANGFKELKLFAKNNKNKTLTIMTSDALANAMEKRFEEACLVKQIGEWKYTYQCPSNVHIYELNFNQADFEGLQHLAAAYELIFSLYNSYDLSGAIQVAQNHKNDLSKPHPQQIIDELLANKNFGLLREGNGLKKIKEMGFDAILGIRWAIQNQSVLCPFGTLHPRNRMGFLFNTGLCIESQDTVTSLKVVEDALNGKILPITYSKSQNGYKYYEYHTAIKPAAWIDTPISDLRALTPLKFNACEELSEVTDTTLGGLYPRSDFNTILKIGNTCH